MTDFARAYRARIGEIQRERAAVITKGACEDISEYRGRCGVLVGLEIAVFEFEELLGQYINEEEIDDI